MELVSTLDARVSVGLYNHPKVKKLIRRVGYEGPWRLMGLWLYARQNKPDGILTDMTAEDIEIAVDWSGRPGELVDALIEVVFLDRDDAGVFRLHDWAEHQPWAAGTRERSAQARFRALKRHHGEKRAREIMGELFHVDHAQRNASGMRGACAAHEGGNAPSPSPSPSPRTEKKPPGGGTDQDTTIWKLGVSLLRKAGSSESAARSFLGQHAKNGQAPKLAEVIARISLHPVADPKAYIAAAMREVRRSQPGTLGPDEVH